MLESKILFSEVDWSVQSPSATLGPHGGHLGFYFEEGFNLGTALFFFWGGGLILRSSPEVGFLIKKVLIWGRPYFGVGLILRSSPEVVFILRSSSF